MPLDDVPLWGPTIPDGKFAWSHEWVRRKARAFGGDNINSKKCFVFYHVLIQGVKDPLENYVIKYKALLVVDVVKLTVNLTGLIIMLSTPWHLA